MNTQNKSWKKPVLIVIGRGTSGRKSLKCNVKAVVFPIRVDLSRSDMYHD